MSNDLVGEERKELFSKIRNLKKRAFLAAFCRIGQIEKASRKAKVHWTSHYRWLEIDPVYAQAFERARKIVADRMEGSLIDSTLHGDDKVITYEGKITGTYKQKSDIIRIFMMKGMKPEYRDNFLLNSIAGPAQLNIIHSSVVSAVMSAPTPSAAPATIDVSGDGSESADD
jgi:hypothetical protein